MKHPGGGHRAAFRHREIAMTNQVSTPEDLSAAFREAFRHHPSGVAVISADPGEGPVALTVSSLISISMSPPTVAFSLSSKSSTADAIRRAESLVIHFMRLENMHLAQLCATSGADRFGSSVNWDRLPSGEPYFPDVRIWFLAKPLHELSVEGATLMVAQLTEGRLADSDPLPEANSMVYLNRQWHGLRRLLETE